MQQRADAIWGLAVTSMLLLDRRGLLEPYAPKNLADDQAQRSAIPPIRRPGSAWNAWVAARVLQHDRRRTKAGSAQARSRGSTSLDPRFKGKITMPHPASSGTGYFHVSALDPDVSARRSAWEFMDRLHDNIAVYEHSGIADPAGRRRRVTIPDRHLVRAARPRRRVARRARRSKGLMMKEGGGWDMDAAAILRGTTKPRRRPAA